MKVVKIIFCATCWSIIQIKRIVFGKGKFPQGDSYKILLVSCEGIGNAILSIPFVYTLKRNFRNSSIEVLTTSHSHQLLFEGTRCCDRVMLYERKMMKRIRLFFELRKRKYDFCFLAFPTLSLPKETIPLFINSRFNICHDYARLHSYFIYVKDLFHRTIPIEEDYHDIEQHLNLLHDFPAINREIDRYPIFHFTDEVRQYAKDFFSKHRIHKNDVMIAIHTGSSSGALYKRWPLENFLSVAEQLKNNVNAKIIYIAGPDEIDLRERLVMNDDVLLETPDIRKVLCVLSDCDLFISNDSGIMHVASMARIPILTIWGGTSEKRNGARADRVINILPDEMPCRPCVKFVPLITCEKGECDCIRTISVDTVYRAAAHVFDTDHQRKSMNETR